MLVLILLGMFIAVGYTALQHYHAEKYAKRHVYGQEVHFLEFMFSNHPVIAIVSVLLLILIALAIILPR